MTSKRHFRAGSAQQRALLAFVAATALRASAACAVDFRFDTCTWGVDGFGQTQLDHLSWSSPNGHVVAMPDDSHRSTIESSGNTYGGYYNTLTNEYTASNHDPAVAASAIRGYVVGNSTHGPPPSWVVLNEMSTSLWPNNADYRSWLRGTVNRLKTQYNYNVILFSPFPNPFANGADWQPLSQDCYIAVENYLSGQEMKDNAFSVTWAQNQYRSSVTSYSARGVDPSRLFIGEDFEQSNAGVGYGRAGVTAAEWNRAIVARHDAIRNVGFAGFIGYAWSHNEMGAPLSDRLGFEDTYRSHIVVESEGPRWNLNANGSWNTSSNWTRAAVQSINVPPNGMSDVANFVAALSAARTVTLDGAKTVGRMTFNSANGYTIAPGTGGSLTFSNNGLNGSITLAQGSHTIAAPVTLADGIDLKINSGTLTLTGMLTNSGGKTINKSGPGSLAIGAQSNGAGATINVTGGALILNADAGSPFSAQLSINSTTGSVTFKSTQHLASLHVSTTAVVSAGGSRVLYTRSLAIDPNARLDLNDNDLILQSTAGNRSADFNRVYGQIKTAINGVSGPWSGNGISSSTAAADTNLLHALGILLNDDATLGGAGNAIYPTFSGQAVDKNAILVKSTYFGDADLSGVVDSTDYFQIDNGFKNHQTGWVNGDFDYNATVDSTDYFLIDNAFNHHGAALTPARSQTSAVPEPTTAAALAASAVAVTGRRRRRSW